MLADTSAWHRSAAPQVAGVWRHYLEEDRIATTTPIRLEVLYSARSAADYEAVARELDALHQLPCGEEALQRALEVQAALAKHKPLHHRIPVPDLIIAAVAELAGAIVWHYDQEYERIAQVTGQPIQWIARRGTIS
ncbi:MAG: PIN domain nuclease [Acidimicrobiia bacterium]